MTADIPIGTNWNQNVLSTIGNSIVSSTVLVVNQATQTKGTGWVVSRGHVMTNEHVIRGAKPAQIIIHLSDGKRGSSSEIEHDSNMDIAVVKMPDDIGAPLPIDISGLSIGTQICTWGHPLGYNGPAPILTVGYLAGFNQFEQRGVVFTASDNKGNQKNFVGSQIVAEILSYFRDMTQVVIGEAIPALDLVGFLNTHKIPWASAH